MFVIALSFYFDNFHVFFGLPRVIEVNQIVVKSQRFGLTTKQMFQTILRVSKSKHCEIKVNISGTLHEMF